MMAWLLYFLMAVIEGCGTVFFLDTFLEPKQTFKKPAKRFVVIFIAQTSATILTSALMKQYDSIIRMFLVILAVAAALKIAYCADWILCLFFSALNYVLLLLIDASFVWAFGAMPKSSASLRIYGYGFVLRLFWVVLLIFMRKNLSSLKSWFLRGDRPWLKFAWFPFVSVGIGLYYMMDITLREEKNLFYSFISLGLLCLNVATLFFLKYSLKKDEQIEGIRFQLQKKENQLQVFSDMKAVTDRQGQKLHDYKKQLEAISELLRNGDIKEAVDITEKLSKTISVEMSQINTGNPVVNAVLNQEYRKAMSKNIGMIFTICDLSELFIEGEDIVVLFGNLLDNAIHECERVGENGDTPVIQVKTARKEGKYIFSVKNPVVRMVRIEDNRVMEEIPGGHGVGLINVREAVTKYDGSFVISCNEKEFIAVAIIREEMGL